MGTLSKITNAVTTDSSNSSSLAKGSHSINQEVILKQTSQNVFTPTSTGTWETVRTNEVVQAPRYYSEEEAKQLKEQAKAKGAEARHSKQAFKALARIEEADTKVHEEHRRYVRKVAKAELGKKQADAKTAKFFHGLRPQYARLGLGVEQASSKADERITELQNRFKSVR